MSLELLDYRRIVFSNYAELRNSKLEPEDRLLQFRKSRDALFREHSQSALTAAQKRTFQGLDYFAYDPDWRKLGTLDFDVERVEIDIALKDDGQFRIKPLARASFTHARQDLSLMIYWVCGYAGGLFLPFRDKGSRNGDIYGGGRYLLDTIKGADLGMDNDRIVLDFNYAYNPSCAYNEKWDCPLAPHENWLDVDILAGEKKFPQLNIGA